MYLKHTLAKLTFVIKLPENGTLVSEHVGGRLALTCIMY
jgi:hypothetical protein